ncbi:MAG: DUF2029 domain-containing protein [Alphaproteobacteria bacterium]|nr:DUF2029 domain-containing protein [Alphaproteobacteria bacterium]
MTAQTVQLGDEGAPRRFDALPLVCFGLLVANVALLLVFSNGLIVGLDGRPAPSDFLNVYGAGRLVLESQAPAAYDWDVLHATENALVGRAVTTYFGWHYPPPFLAVAAALASLPYAAAFVAWFAVTLPLYLVTIRAIVRAPVGWLVAGAFPALLPNIIPGQNGFLTAALIGGTLVLLERQPWLAGVCLGLLTYKPQFGILFPLLLVAGGYWRAIASATVTAVALALGSVALFGTATWAAFFHWLPLTSQALFSDGAHHADWSKFQSLFALVRMLGGGATFAWTLQLALSAVTALLLCATWRDTRIAFPLKAAATATAVLLATPYVYLYDLTVLAVAVAFLLRHAMNRGFARAETIGLGLVTALVLVMPFFEVPVGLPAAAIVAALIARRALGEELRPLARAY